jgi:hypothetical protein
MITCLQFAYGAADNPCDVTREFYHWYFKQDRKINPLSLNDINLYVNRCTVNKWRINLKRATVEADYFTDSQDPDPAWAQTFIVHNPIVIDERTSLVVVRFNMDDNLAPNIAVFLNKEENTFKIIKVANLNGYY